MDRDTATAKANYCGPGIYGIYAQRPDHNTGNYAPYSFPYLMLQLQEKVEISSGKRTVYFNCKYYVIIFTRKLQGCLLWFWPLREIPTLAITSGSSSKKKTRSLTCIYHLNQGGLFARPARNAIFCNARIKSFIFFSAWWDVKNMKSLLINF